MIGNPPPDDPSLEQLRRLLLGAQLEELEQLKQKLLDREQFSSEVSKILPDAILKSAKKGEQLSQAMVPTVEQIVSLSIKRDIKKFASVLFPVIGPAIRKSISETIRQMLQSLNQTLEYGLSWRGIKWRMESLRTGIPFAQVVMLHSLVYRVEQVFLIHRESGLLLNHVGLENAVNQDADMVSSMLSAIGDFVGDSFQVENRQALDAIQVGDFSILIEQGPEAILAVAVRGEAPGSLRNVLQKVLEDIQQEFSDRLQHFSGDTEVFMPARAQLMQCMDQAKYTTRNKSISLRTWLVLLTLLILLIYWVVSSLYLTRQQHDYVAQLQQQPGYVITEIDYADDKLAISGLKDPLARDPHKFLALSTLDPATVQLQFEPYQSLKPRFVAQRLLKILNPPVNTRLQFNHGVATLSGFASTDKASEMQTMAALLGGVTEVDSRHLKTHIDLSALQPPPSVKLDLDINNGILRASGSALPQWRDQARERVGKIDGILRYDDSLLESQFDLTVFQPPESVSLELQNGTLTVTGHASQQWLLSLQQQASQYPEINQLDTSQLHNDTQQQLQQDIAELEHQNIFFDVALSFNFEANDAFNHVVALAQRIIKNAQQLSSDIQIVVRGHSDSVGNFADNRALSLERADYVAQYLFNTGISPRFIVVKGIESRVPRENSAAQRRYNRRVTFEVIRPSASITH